MPSDDIDWRSIAEATHARVVELIRAGEKAMFRSWHLFKNVELDRAGLRAATRAFRLRR